MTDSHVFWAILVLWTGYIGFLYGQSTATCPDTPLAWPTAKLKESHEQEGKPLYCVYEVQVVRPSRSRKSS